ncbi:MAG: hypothetical protein ACKO3R_01045 [bacterium]
MTAGITEAKKKIARRLDEKKLGYSRHFQRLAEIKGSSQIRTHNFKLTIPFESSFLNQRFSDLSQIINTSDSKSLLNALIEFYKLGFVFVSAADMQKQLRRKLGINFTNLSDSVQNSVCQRRESLSSFMKLRVKGNQEGCRKAICDDRKIKYLLEIFCNCDFNQLENDMKIALENYLKQITPSLKPEDNFPQGIDNLIEFYKHLKQIFIESENLNESPSLKDATKRAWKKAFPDDKSITNLTTLGQESDSDQTFIIYFQSHSDKDLSAFYQERIKEWQEYTIYQLYFQQFKILSKSDLFRSFSEEHHIEKEQKGSSEEDGQKINLQKYLMGFGGENYSGLSNFFGKTLHDFKNDENATRKKLIAANPSLFMDNEDLLNIYVAKIRRIAKEIPDSSISFTTGKGFGLYRSHVGLKFASWLSNFENRLDEFDKYFKESNIYKEIHEHLIDKASKELLDSGNFIFSLAYIELIKKLSEDYRNLQKDFSLLKDDSAEHLGLNNLQKRLETHAEESQEIRAYFNRLNNEGIKIDEHNKYLEDFLDKKKSKNHNEEDCEESEEDQSEERYKWKEKYIPKKIKKWPAFFGQGRKPEYGELGAAASTLKDSSKKIFKILDNIQSGEGLEKEDFSHSYSEKEKRSFAEVEFRKTLSSLHRVYLRYTDDSQTLKKSLKEIFESYHNGINLDDSFLVSFSGNSSEEKYKFYINPNFQQKNKSVIIKEVHFAEGLKFDKSLLLDLKGKLQKLLSIENVFDLDDFIDLKNFYNLDIEGFATEASLFKAEILKIYLGLSFKLLKDTLDFSEIFKNINPKDDFSLDIHDERYYAHREWIIHEDKYRDKEGKQLLTKFIQASICSKLKASLTLLSKREYIKNHTITLVEDIFNLRYVLVDESRFDEATDDICNKLIKLRNDRKSASEAERIVINRKIRRLNNAKTKLGYTSQKNKSNLINNFSLSFSNLDKVKNLYEKFQKDNKENLEISSPKDLVSRIFELKKEEYYPLLAALPHRWELVIKSAGKIDGLDDSRKEQKEEFDKIYLINKAGLEEILSTRKSKNHYYSLPIETSVYQKQFLDKFLWGFDDNLKDLKIKLPQISLIWKVKHKLKSIKALYDGLDLNEENEAKEYSLFASIPFSIKNNRKTESEIDFLNQDNLKKKDNKFSGTEENLLGIDLGEYGFGWAVYNTRAGEFLNHGFHRVRLLDSLRKQVYSWKDSQSIGSFYSADTKIARLREHATGQIRNKIHQLAMEHKARPVYESEVDNFEAGADKIKRLYKTLKRSDVSLGKNDNKTDQAIRKHIWGTPSGIAKTISAFYTSQISRRTGGKHKDKRDVLEMDKVSIYETMNWKGIYTQNEKSEKLNSYIKPFGGQAIYKDLDGSACLADVQAAQNIAIKYFIKFAPGFKDKRLNFYKLYSLLKYFKELSEDERESVISQRDTLEDIYNLYSSMNNIDFFSNPNAKCSFRKLLESDDLSELFKSLVSHLESFAGTDQQDSRENQSLGIIKILKMTSEDYYKSKDSKNKETGLSPFPINLFFVYLADELKDENFTTKDAEITGFTHKGFDKLVQEKVKSL